jgi:hypothetical protein
MRLVLRRALVIAFALLFAAPGAFAMDGCSVCKVIQFSDGTAYMFRDRPAAPQWGNNYCAVEYYPEATYCFACLLQQRRDLHVLQPA